jgi:hypothetical protein
LINSNQFCAILVVTAFFFPGFVSAEETTVAEKEIAHLLQYMSESDCIFIRNGREYDGKRARQHMERKYNYAKRAILTADSFIEKIATRSSRSGKPYKVRCKDVEMPSADWFRAELERFRKHKENDQGSGDLKIKTSLFSLAPIPFKVISH